MPGIIAFLATLLTFTAARALADGDHLLTFGYPPNVTVDYGEVEFGAEPPRLERTIEPLPFRICGAQQQEDQLVVYGYTKSDRHRPQVWRARTTDGIIYTDAEMLYEAPAPETRWLAGDVALKHGVLLLLQSQLGRPAMKGHPFYAFSGPLAGGEWRQLAPEPLYRGQDSFHLVWSEDLSRFVNYQISYQPWKKRFRDNMPKARRVLHIRTSPDGVEWTPGASFGAAGPYLPDEQLITPGEADSPDAEFYHFAPLDFGEFWAGILVKYVSQPANLPKCKPFPHGPLLGYEWWISKDGLDWLRPFGDNSALEGIRHPLGYFPPQPLVAGHELRFPSRDRLYTMDRRRMFYLYSHANGQVTTRPVDPAGEPIRLQVSFESVRRDADRIVRQGYLMAELVDAEGEVLPGFDREQCVFMPSEKTELTLKWGERHLPEETTGPVRLRLLFRDLRLYSASW